ncbi:MAG: hypothetical protein P9M15_04280, partial [Candidatus Electryoneaceae bacterium]|nr:hypothetical protein [Candidatus Electryoneaceae bacterium]
QEQMSQFGAGFDVASVSNKITIRMVVPIDQPDPRFGHRNANLTGEAVRTEGVRVVENEIEIDYPMDSPPVGKSPFPSLDPSRLDIGQSYTISKRTLLMPSPGYRNDFQVQDVKHIPKGGGFKVLEMVKMRITHWYKVTAFDQRLTLIGTGWVNSTALGGQVLKAYN